MVLYGNNYPNPNWGYGTTIEMALDIVNLGSGNISSFDNGQKYDKYTCKCTIILDYTQMMSLYSNYQDTNRGVSTKLIADDGFYPFGVGVNMPSGGYDVYLDKITNKGAVDKLGKQFRVDLVFILAYSSPISYKSIDENYCRLGRLEFATFLRTIYPQGGFKSVQEIGVINQHTAGGEVSVVNYLNDKEYNESNFTLELRDDMAGNLVNRLVNNFRGNIINIKGAENYFIFTASEGYGILYSVKMKSNIIKIKHKAHNIHSISIGIVKND